MLRRAFLVIVLFLTVVGSIAVFFVISNPNITTSSLGQLPSCGSMKTFFSVLPIPWNDTLSIVPLGQETPGDHILPAPHSYITSRDGDAPIYAPGNLTLISLGIRHFDKLGNLVNFSDYTLEFQPCDEVYLYFHNVLTLTYPPFVQAAQQVLQTCHFSSVKQNEEYCSGAVNIHVSAGQFIGTASSMDIGARDLRLSTGKSAFIDPAKSCPTGDIFERCFTVCPFDYFTSSSITQIKFTSSDGLISRTEPPVCGSVYNDVPNTLQGNWFNSTISVASISPESQDLFLGPDHIQIGLQIISIGNTASTIPFGIYQFYALNSGLMNRNFSQVTADGKIYCYQTFPPPPPQNAHSMNQTSILLMQLVNSTTVRIEKISSSSCGSGSWTFDSSYTDFLR